MEPRTVDEWEAAYLALAAQLREMDRQVRLLTGFNSGGNAAIDKLLADTAAVKAENAELRKRNEAQAEDLCNWFRTHEENAMCQEGHAQIWYVSRTLREESDCPMCDLRAKAERYEDLMVQSLTVAGDDTLREQARAIRARREGSHE